jgi:hypothetical protein
LPGGKIFVQKGAAGCNEQPHNKHECYKNMPLKVTQRDGLQYLIKILYKNMKKLSLNALAFQKGEVLTRSQLKKVLGGSGSGTGSGRGVCNFHSCTDQAY